MAVLVMTVWCCGKEFVNFGNDGFGQRIETLKGMPYIASSEASQAEKRAADYICNGESDQEEFRNAIDDLPSVASVRWAHTGSIFLSSGSFYFDAPLQIGSATTQESINIYGAGGIDTSIIRPDPDLTKPISLIIIGEHTGSPTGTDAAKISMVNITNLKIEGDKEHTATQEYSIEDISNTNQTITVTGDHSDYLESMQVFRVLGTTKNDGFTCANSVSVVDGNTVVETTRTVYDETATGTCNIAKPLIDCRGIKDSKFDHVYINGSAGIGVLLRRAWTVTFRDCPIERTTDGAIVAYSNMSPWNNYLGKFIKVEGCTFAQLYKDSSGTIFDDENGDNYPVNGAAITLVSEGPDSSVQRIVIKNNHIDFHTNAIELDGIMSDIFISDNWLAPSDLPASDTYYGLKVITEKENGNGAKNVFFGNNTVIVDDLSGNLLKSLVGVVESEAGFGSLDNIDSQYNYQSQIAATIPITEYNIESTANHKMDESRCIPGNYNAAINPSSSPYALFSPFCWGDWIITNKNMSGNLHLDLPFARAGMQLRLHRLNSSYDLYFDPMGSNTIDGSADKRISTDTKVLIEAPADGQWVTIISN